MDMTLVLVVIMILALIMAMIWALVTEWRATWQLSAQVSQIDSLLEQLLNDPPPPPRDSADPSAFAPVSSYKIASMTVNSQQVVTQRRSSTRTARWRLKTGTRRTISGDVLDRALAGTARARQPRHGNTQPPNNKGDTQ